MHAFQALTFALNHAHQLTHQASRLGISTKRDRGIPSPDHEAGMVRLLARALDDFEPDVAEVAAASLEALIDRYPPVVDRLAVAALDDGIANIPLYNLLLRVGTPAAVAGVLDALQAFERTEDWHVVVTALGEATAVLPDSCFEAMLEQRDDDSQRRVAATVLARRGHPRGAHVAFECYPTDTLIDEYIARGPLGIRAVCAGASRSGQACQFVASRLANLYVDRTAVVYEIAANPSWRGDRAATCVLGYWDEPEAVDLLLHIAVDPRRSPAVREEATAALCRLEAPEAIDLLTSILLDPDADESQRCQCADTLGEIGNHGPLSALRAAARYDLHGQVGMHARAAIANILHGGSAPLATLEGAKR